jgi:delta24-sterol reductase
MDASIEHERATRKIALEVRQFSDKKQAFHIYHGTTNCSRQTSFDRDRVVDTSSLCNVLALDVGSGIVNVEPNVSMERLVRETLASGMLPKVVMEFPNITVGGGFSGTSGESSSFRHGPFEQTVDSIEMILADGTLVTASAAENADLFYGAASIFGSLGVVTLLRIQLVSAQPFVELVYWPVRGRAETLLKIKEETDRLENDFVDAILFGRNSGVVMSGRLVSKVSHGYKPHLFRHAKDPWFYMEARQKARSSVAETVFIPVIDYLFRYDRGAFWGGHYALKYFMTPNLRIMRWALDYFLRAKTLYHVIHAGKIAEHFFIQDLMLPWGKVEAFLDYVDQDFGLYPLWLCPFGDTHSKQASLFSKVFSKSGAETEMGLNVGVWGPSSTDKQRFRAVNRQLESRLSELGGQKALYARAYYTEEEFWHIYDLEWYQSLRSKYKAGSLPSIYDKVTRGNGGVEDGTNQLSKSLKARLVARAWETRPLPGIYGIWKTARGSEYLLGHCRPGRPDKSKC